MGGVEPLGRMDEEADRAGGAELLAGSTALIIS